MKLQDIKSEYKIQADSGDRWGSAMSAYFDLVAELYYRGEDIPDSWQYSPGCAVDPREPDAYMYGIFQDADSNTLVKFGNILERYTRNLDRLGESY